MPCYGTLDDHCCYLKGTPCPFIITDHVDDVGRLRKWACSLRAEYGNWDDVIASDRYNEVVAPVFQPMGINCRDWPESNPYHKCDCSKEV